MSRTSESAADVQVLKLLRACMTMCDGRSAPSGEVHCQSRGAVCTTPAMRRANTVGAIEALVAKEEGGGDGAALQCRTVCRRIPPCSRLSPLWREGRGVWPEKKTSH